MSERTFRPPKLVRKAAQAGLVLGSRHQLDDNSAVAQAETLLSTTPLSLLEIRALHTSLTRLHADYDPHLSKHDRPTDGTIKWLLCGGDEGLIWTRRVLRQEKVLKTNSGKIQIPEIIDLRFGPHIMVAHVSDTDVVAKLQTLEIPAGVSQTHDGSFIFFTPTVSVIPVEKVVSKRGTYALGQPAQLPAIDCESLTFVDESRSRVQVLLKGLQNPTDVSGFDCFEFDRAHYAGLTGKTLLEGLTVNKLFCLISTESPRYRAEFLKVDEELGLVMGWAIISLANGEPYFDKQGDYIPENSMLEAATEFMLNSRIAGDMHDGDSHGRIVFAWPMTTEIAKAFEFDVSTTGLMIAMKPDNEEMLEKFRDGTYTGFSIGGTRIEDEEVD